MKSKDRLVFFNGEFIKESDAKISIYDSALMFGDMVFEMTRSFKKKQFKLREHIERLLLGVKIFRIPINYSADQIEDACYKTIEVNDHLFSPDDEHRLMIDVSRGLLGIYQGIEGLHKGSNLIIADFPLKWTVSKMGKLFDEGINAVVTSQRAIPSHLMDPKIKNRSRVFYLMANIEASQIKGDNNWALLLDPDGYIAEGTGDNFFIVKDKKVITPEGRNILRGISRAYVMDDLCRELDLEVVEKNIELYDVYDADEAFMTGTPFCMLPVTSINGLSIGDRKVGPVFKLLIKKWGVNNGIDIIKQIKEWDKNCVDDYSNAPSPYKFSK